MHATRYRAGLAAALAAAAVLAGCSSGDSDTTAAPAPSPPPAAGTTLPTQVPVTGLGAKAGFSGRGARVYDAYYSHCREYTPAALIWPDDAPSATVAAKRYAGPPRELQQAAYRGCLAGLEHSTGRVTVAKVKALAEEEAEEHGMTLPEGGGG
jgi:hypothetical protein